MKKSSSGDYSKSRNKYLSPGFWLNETNFFWENDSFTESGKEYFRASVRRMAETALHSGKPNLISIIETRR